MPATRRHADQNSASGTPRRHGASNRKTQREGQEKGNLLDELGDTRGDACRVSGRRRGISLAQEITGHGIRRLRIALLVKERTLAPVHTCDSRACVCNGHGCVMRAHAVLHTHGRAHSGTIHVWTRSGAALGTGAAPATARRRDSTHPRADRTVPLASPLVVRATPRAGPPRARLNTQQKKDPWSPREVSESHLFVHDDLQKTPKTHPRNSSQNIPRHIAARANREVSQTRRCPRSPAPNHP